MTLNTIHAVSCGGEVNGATTYNPQLEKALALARQGIPVFPCRAHAEIDQNTGKKRKAKTPYTLHGHKNATTNEDMLHTWFGMLHPGSLVGYVTGEKSGIDLLDLDQKDGKDGVAAIERVCPGGLPETFGYKTQNGGKHLLFGHRKGTKVKSLDNRFKATLGTGETGIDTKGEGGYGIWHSPVVPPNIHELLKPWPKALTEALERDQALERNRKAREPRKDNAPRDSSTFPAPDLERDYDRIVDALKFIPADGYETWIAVGMALKADFGDDARELWDQWSATSGKFRDADPNKHWRSFNGAGRGLGTLFHIAQGYGYKPARANGAHYEHGLNGAGSGSSASAEDATEQATAAAASEAKNEVEIYTAEQLQGMEFPPVKFIPDYPDITSGAMT